MKRGKRDGDMSEGDINQDHATLEALARSLQKDTGTDVNVPLVIAEGILVALLIFSFVYSWPVWSSLLLVVLVGVVVVVSLSRRPAVAPLELTAAERERVRRVVKEHGVRPAVTLVRGLYPDEPPATASRTVKLVMERMLAEDDAPAGRKRQH